VPPPVQVTSQPLQQSKMQQAMAANKETLKISDRFSIK
jgi:hypothetical protein